MTYWHRLAALTAAVSSVAAQAAITLTGDTSSPDMSVVSAGSGVQLTFSAAGMAPSQSLNLQLTFVNERGEVIETRTVPVTADSSGKWSGTIDAPAGKLGYYRANAQLSNGVQLSASGSRGAGYLTYAVVPDPAQRVDYGEAKSRFGIQGGFGRNWGNAAMQYLGARWGLDGGFEWSRNEPNYAGQWDGNAGSTPTEPWKTYRLPTLFVAPAWAVIPSTLRYNTGALTPEGEVAWEQYVKKAAQAFVAKYPDREKDIYQITWEPIRSWGFNGTDEQLLRIYEIAYNAIHSVDPKAVVAGPTMGIHAEGAYPNHYERETQSVALFQKGLANYLDAYTAHPYYAAAWDAGSPEAERMVDRIRYLKGILQQYGGGKSIPMYGTEQGMADDGTLAGELRVARTLIRENLITLGEGFEFNIAFYAVDYSYSLGGTIERYGFFYNLVNGTPWGPEKAAPKPIVPAYAAMTLLLDGHDSAGAMEDMGGTRWGYRFKREEESRMVQALWDYGNSPTTYQLYTGLDYVTVYDWMGNPQWMTTDDGVLTLSLSQEPVYVITPPAWNVDGNASWNSAGSWTTLVPNSSGAEAHFTGIATSRRTVSVDTPATVGLIYLRNSHGYDIVGPGGLTLDTSAGKALIDVVEGQHSISTPLTLKRDLVVQTHSAESALGLGILQESDDKTLTKRGAGQLNLTGGIALARLDVEGGQLRIAPSSGALDTAALQLAASASIDISDNALIVRNGDVDALHALVGNAFRGRWIGEGIGSQVAHDDATFLSALGVFRNDDGAGSPLYASFAGVGNLLANDVIIALVRYGDTDLNGLIDEADYARMGSSPYWAGGDFNYDGEVNAIDYALIDYTAMLEGSPLFADMHALHLGMYGQEYQQVFAALEAGTFFVPEPTGVAYGLMLAGGGLLRRRRNIACRA